MPNRKTTAQINTRVSLTAKQRLMYACEVKGNGLGYVNQGMVLTQLIMTHLPPAPDERRPVKKTADAAKVLRAVAS